MKNENTHAYTDMHMHTVYGVTWLHVKTTVMQRKETTEILTMFIHFLH